MLRFLILGEKNKSCVIYPRDNVLGVSFPRGNYVGNKSSERQFSSVAISRVILSGGNYLRDNCPGAIIQGGILLGGNFPDTVSASFFFLLLRLFIIYYLLVTYLFRKHKYKFTNTSYNFKQKYVCRWPVEN